MPAKLVPDWEIPARGLYGEYSQRQRDEAVRTGTFGAAVMIYAARSLGLGSTPMIGFDAEAVHREFGLADETGRRSRAVRWPRCSTSSDPRGRSRLSSWASPMRSPSGRRPGYCIVDRDVGTIRWMCAFSRSRQSGTRGAILVFQ